ncbi:MAG: glycosyltransferase family 2 protein [Firmicutes bacterium]|nr:glycosyltransferase family 2 protein [Bacillota bacterium]
MFKNRLENACVKRTVAAVVPAYNEAETICEVVGVLQGVADIDEIIVVNDGSTDETANKAAEMGVRIINLYPNRGKGGAMKAGVQATAAEIILFIDADLVGLSEEHCRKLLEPVLREQADMTVGLFSGGRTTTTLAQKVAPFLSGQRAVRREIIECVPELEESRYGVEVAISRYASTNSFRVEKITLHDVSQVMKEEKQGFMTGAKNRFLMYWEIIKVLKPTKR